MPKESAAVDAAVALVRTAPFGGVHRIAAEFFGVTGLEGPLWLEPAARRQVADTLGPLVYRLKHRVVRTGAVLADAASPLAERFDGLAAAWVAVAAADDPSVYDLHWRPGAPPPAELESAHSDRERSLGAIAAAWPATSPAAERLRTDVWRAAWLDEGFIDLRGTEGRPTAPVVIRGSLGAPRSRVAELLAPAAEEPRWLCCLPADDASARIRSPGAERLRFVDRLGSASADVQAALVERLSTGERGPRWAFGLTTAADLGALDPELKLRVVGAEVDIPSLGALMGRDGLVLYVTQILAASGLDGREDRAREIVDWIRQHLGAKYPWPGHLAELARCVRARLSGRPFHPVTSPTEDGLPPDLMTGVTEGELDADTLLSRYCTWVYALTGSYVATAARLGIDRRTVRKRVDPELLPIFADRNGV